MTTWEEGARAHPTARSFSTETDEPAQPGGIDYRDLRIEVSGNDDLRGYLDLDGATRPGFSDSSYTVTVDSGATPEQLAEIKNAAERTSPRFDNVLNATPLNGRAAAPA